MALKIKTTYVILWLAAFAIAGALTYLLITTYEDQKNYTTVEIMVFNKKPTDFSSGLYNSIDKMTEKERETIYARKIIIHDDKYSPEKHKAKHPNDIAIRTILNNESVVILLTNEILHGHIYFVR